MIPSIFAAFLHLAAGPAAQAQGMPSAPPPPPREAYTPLNSGELADTAHVLPKGAQQIRLSTRSSFTLGGKAQLDVWLLGALGRPGAGIEVPVVNGDRLALSLTPAGSATWSGASWDASLLSTLTLRVADYDRVNLALGYGKLQETTVTGRGTKNEATAVLNADSLPLRLSYDRVKTDRQNFRVQLNLDLGPTLSGGTVSANGGVAWAWAWRTLRLNVGPGLVYTPNLGAGVNRALAVIGEGPINFPNVLPWLYLNLWWTF